MIVPDESGLLAALVLAPATYSRNRFFGLYAQGGLMRVRRRASQLRGLVQAIASGVAHTVESRGEGFCIRLQAPEMRLHRTAFLSVFEVAVIDVAVARGKGLEAPLGADALVRSALAKLRGPLNQEPAAERDSAS